MTKAWQYVLTTTVAVTIVGAAMFSTKGNIQSGWLARKSSISSVAQASLTPDYVAPPSRRMLAAQVLVLESKNYLDLERQFAELASMGVNTVIVRAFQNLGDRTHQLARPGKKVGVYFQTDHAPVVDPILESLVPIARRHRLKIFAWMETRKMPLLHPSPNNGKALAYSFENRTTELVEQWSIFDDTVKYRLSRVYADVAATGVDGILIQDDLVMRHNEDFSPKGTSLFQEETNHRPDPNEMYRRPYRSDNGRWYVPEYSNTFWLWSQWKNQKLLDLARQLIEAAREVNPDIEIAMNFMYEAVTHSQNALAWLSQSLAEATRLPIDYFAIMAYHRQIKEELSLTDEATLHTISTMTNKLLQTIADPHKILMKIQLTDWNTRKPICPEETNVVFQQINNQGNVSLAFVPWSPEIPLDDLIKSKS